MSRWLVANYKRQAIDATPQHENIEKQWKAEQWQKELNKPGIEYKLKEEETPKYFIDNLEPVKPVWFGDDKYNLAEDIVNELKKHSDKLEQYHKYLNSDDYNKDTFIKMLISDIKSFGLDTNTYAESYANRTDNMFTTENYKQYIIAHLEADAFSNISNLPSPMKERVEEVCKDLASLESISKNPLLYIVLFSMILLSAGVIGYMTIDAIMTEAANHFKKDK